MTPRDRTTKARLSMTAVRGEVANLEKLAPQWDDLYPDAQTDFEGEWLHAMGHLRRPERLYSAGELTDPKERDYAPLRARVADLLPTIERLELPPPGFPIDRRRA